MQNRQCAHAIRFLFVTAAVQFPNKKVFFCWYFKVFGFFRHFQIGSYKLIQSQNVAGYTRKSCKINHQIWQFYDRTIYFSVVGTKFDEKKVKLSLFASRSKVFRSHAYLKMAEIRKVLSNFLSLGIYLCVCGEQIERLPEWFPCVIQNRIDFVLENYLRNVHKAIKVSSSLCLI